MLKIRCVLSETHYIFTIYCIYYIYNLNVIDSYSKPFDRHDWIVERDGKEVRYVLDFYKGAAPRKEFAHMNMPVSVFLDVRPAIDNASSLFDRISFYLRQNFYIPSLPLQCTPNKITGLAAYIKATKQQSD